MKNLLIEKTKKIMKELKVKGEIIEHLEIDGTNSENIANSLKIPLDHIIKCLILKSKKGTLISTIILGNQRLNMKKMESISGEKKFSLASKETVEKATGYSIGGVPPYAVINRLPLYIDIEVMKKSYIIGSAGTPYHGLKLDPATFRRFQVNISDICIN